ncbi:MAG: glycosyltransferase, partial [Burkholderiaceae bacterium]
AEAMNRIQTEYGGRVQIEVIGAFQRQEPLFGVRVPLPRSSDYPNFVRWLHQRVHWDIGIIPLLDDEFNRSKSSLKFLEYAALEMAIVCSDVPAYAGVARHEVNALVVSNTREAWYEAVRELIEDEGKRRRLAEAATAQLKSQHTLEHNAAGLQALLSSGPQQSEQRPEPLSAPMTAAA